MAKSVETYEYSPLGENLIRVITILDVESNGPICGLEIVPLNASLDFDAISYCWGNPEKSKTIICEGKSLWVPGDLHDMLHHLYEPGCRKIWIDAVCINQSDDGEKASQVRIMDQVYKMASNVLVWLGLSADNSDLVFDHASVVIDRCASISERFVDENQLPSFKLPDVTHPLWHAVGDLLGRRWFTRLWVIQEVVLASNVIVACGSKRITWHLLGQLAGEITRIGLCAAARGNRIPNPHRSDGFGAIESIDILRKQYKDRMTPPNPYGFLGIVGLGREKDVTEPVDRIYGLLGLANDSVRKSIKIDYSKEHREKFWKVYIEFGKLWAKMDYRYLLSTAPSNDRPSELPSWCPNFNFGTSVAFPFGAVDGYKAGFVEKKPGSAETLAGSDYIKIPGFRIDHIEKVVRSSWSWSQFPDDTKGPTGLAAQLLTYEAECFDLSRQSCLPSEEILDAHWRTLVANNVTGHSPASANFFQSYLNAGRWWAALREQDPQSTELLSERLGLTREAQISMLTFMSALVSYQDRKFFSTVHGRVGLGPPDVLPSDVICVFESAYPVFVLRYAPDSSVARLIGDAYVHGLMDLSLMPSQGREPNEVFVLG